MGARVGAALIGAVAVLGALLTLTAPLDTESRSTSASGFLREWSRRRVDGGIKRGAGMDDCALLS